MPRSGWRAATKAELSFVMGQRQWSYILFLEQVLVISFHVPPSLTQSCSLFAFFTSPAKA